MESQTLTRDLQCFSCSIWSRAHALLHLRANDLICILCILVLVSQTGPSLWHAEKLILNDFVQSWLRNGQCWRRLSCVNINLRCSFKEETRVGTQLSPNHLWDLGESLRASWKPSLQCVRSGEKGLIWVTCSPERPAPSIPRYGVLRS